MYSLLIIPSVIVAHQLLERALCSFHRVRTWLVTHPLGLIGWRFGFVCQVFSQDLVQDLGHFLSLSLGQEVEPPDMAVFDFRLVHVGFLLSKNLGEAYQAGGKLKDWRTCCERQMFAGPPT